QRCGEERLVQARRVAFATMFGRDRCPVRAVECDSTVDDPGGETVGEHFRREASGAAGPGGPGRRRAAARAAEEERARLEGPLPLSRGEDLQLLCRPRQEDVPLLRLR